MLSLTHLQFHWPEQSRPVVDISHLEIAQGEQIFIYGPSGSGKSSLLSLLAGINVPSQGEVSLLGQPFSTLSAKKRDSFRADHIGYIFQNFNLISYLSPIENVMLATAFSKRRAMHATKQDGSIKQSAERLLTALELPQQNWNQSVMSLSIGQQQRVAAARALIGAPEIIIADEPTSALDTDNRERFISLLFQEAKKHHTSIVFVSHDLALAPLFTRSLDITRLANTGARQ